jgi:hypothetical protein
VCTHLVWFPLNLWNCQPYVGWRWSHRALDPVVGRSTQRRWYKKRALARVSELVAVPFPLSAWAFPNASLGWSVRAMTGARPTDRSP